MSKSSGKAFDFAIFLRLYKRGKPYRLPFFMTLVLVLALAGVVWIRPEQMRSMLDEAVPGGNKERIISIGIAFIGMLMFEALIQYIQTQLANRVAQSITFDLRSEIYAHVVKFRLSYFDKTPVGQVVTRVISDVDGIADVFSAGILDIFRDLLKLIFIVGFMFWLDWKMTLIVLIPLPILFYATRLFQQAVKNSFNDVRDQVSRINVFIQEHVSGMHIVQIFNREKQEKERFERINQEHRDAHIRGIWAYSIFFPVVELLSAGSVSLMIWWGLRDSLSGNMTPGLLLEFSTFITMMYRPIRQMADNFNVLQMGVVNAERVFKLLDTQAAQTDTGTSSANKLQGAIRFEHVSFEYIDGQPVLKDINLDIKAGQMVAFVGATGAGKSSIAGLINRFYDFQQGSITIDGTDIHTLQLSTLRSHVALVTQDVFLFNDTILNNITLYDSSISEEAVIAASKEIGAHAFIERLPGGYYYNVRERGGMLSVGQRQLISFVRAYVRNPEVLVLDEATSSVDTESEHLIQHATERLTQNRTSIVIAHRLSTVQRADIIYVVDKGVIAESGSHQDLLNKNGMYRRLFELQFQ
ncbi:MAG: ABC transporter ATP-binding protein [Flavobacteriales bacterium]